MTHHPYTIRPSDNMKKRVMRKKLRRIDALTSSLQGRICAEERPLQRKLYRIHLAFMRHRAQGLIATLSGR